MNSNSFQPNKSTQAEESLPIAMNARRRSTVVRAPTVKVYERWSQFENFRDLSRRCEKCERSMRPASPLAGFAMAKNDNVSFAYYSEFPNSELRGGQFHTALPSVSSRSSGPSIRIQKSPLAKKTLVLTGYGSLKPRVHKKTRDNRAKA